MRLSTGRHVARSEEQKRDNIPTPRFARRPSIRNSFFPAEVPQNSMADQPRLQISELHFDNFSTLSAFSCWKIRFKTQEGACSKSRSEAMLWTEEVEMVDSVDDLKSSHSVQGFAHFPNFEMLDADCVCSEQDHSEFPLQEKCQSGGTESSKRKSVSSRKTVRLHDLRLLSSDWRCNDDVQEFDTRWDEILLLMSKSPKDDVLESLYKLRIRESDQPKTVL